MAKGEEYMIALTRDINKAPSERNSRFGFLIDKLRRGEIIPFLGAGASAFARGQIGGAPPSSLMLTKTLAHNLGISVTYERCEHIRMDLAQIASYFERCKGTRDDLERFLKAEIDRTEYRPNLLHALLARAALIRPMLIITTNYDNLLEKAFEEASAPFEVVATPGSELGDAGEGVGPAMAGGVLHWISGRNPPQADFDRVEANTVLMNADRSLIYKVHGTVPLPPGTGDGQYVISEEDYTHFLGIMGHYEMVPNAVQAKIVASGNRRTRRNALLFLGYSIRDWNMRVLLDGLKIGQYKAGQEIHYAVMKDCGQEERELLLTRKIEVLDCDLEDFTDEVGSQL
jgi:hypothetical protein